MLAGCVFGGGQDGAGSNTDNDADSNGMVADVGSSDARPDAIGNVDADLPDQPVADVGIPDMPIVDPPDVDQPDSEPPIREESALCVGGTASDLIRNHGFRLRVETSDARLSVGVVVPGEGADLMDGTWSTWDSTEFWAGLTFAGPTALETETIVPEPTGIVSIPNGQSPGAFLTRRNAQNCLYANSDLGLTGSVSCSDAWGAEVVNLNAQTHYFWFGEGGTLNSMPANDLDPLGQRITVPWCVRNPDAPTECLPLEYGTVDARASRGPLVLLSDSLGRAYVWDAVQNIDGTQNLEDCVTMPTAPVQLRLGGIPVRFEHADIVRVGTDDFLVHQTPAAVSLHPLGPNHQPQAAVQELPNGGLRPLFDAASDGNRVAAVTAVGSTATVFAFAGGGGVRDVTLDGSTQAIGVAVLGDKVAVAMVRTGFFEVRANGLTMWQ